MTTRHTYSTVLESVHVSVFGFRFSVSVFGFRFSVSVSVSVSVRNSYPPGAQPLQRKDCWHCCHHGDVDVGVEFDSAVHLPGRCSHDLLSFSPAAAAFAASSCSCSGYDDDWLDDSFDGSLPRC